MIETLGIVGYGQFGAFLEKIAERFAPGIRVRIHSRRAEPDEDRFFSLDAVCRSDVVIIASSIAQFAATLEAVVPRLGKRSVLADVATVKLHTAELLKEHAARSERPLRYVATHPMFGPHSYSKVGQSLQGLRIVLTDHSLDPAVYDDVKVALNAVGLVVLEMSADQHDRALAETLFLTHYIGQVVTHGDFLRTEIDTLSFGFLMDAVESVRQDGDLFRDVFRFNPHCRAVVKRFEIAEAKVARMLETFDADG
ncbi:MAG: prephenate dehydrogenase/arogenate dehydrogenase family protein [Roseibium sp.]|uniref:prephenate dehydrogenase/arogenate dehydrogenase family protein n=1 Tax=Roseibium sp. TaxID=1936156 RepID=UPI003D9C47E3